MQRPIVGDVTYNAHADAPIIVLDSGLGGLTVVRALRGALPAENLIYFGDTARLPYGTKSATTVSGFVKQIIRYLRPMRPKHVVIACNTATALALPAVRGEFMDLSISGVIEPGAWAAVAAAAGKEIPVIGVIATEATVRSGAYQRAIQRRHHAAQVHMQPTPLLVHLVEEGRGCDDPLVELALRQYLHPLLVRQIDVLVLGCTHYPMLKPAICRLLGNQIAVIDSAEQCSQDVLSRLASRRLLRDTGDLARGWLRCFVTDDAERFARLASRVLDMQMARPTLVPIAALDHADDEPTPLRMPA